MATIQQVRAAAKCVGVEIEVTTTHGGMKEIQAYAPDGMVFRASGATTLVAHHGRDFAGLCDDIIERLNDGCESAKEEP